MAGEVKFTDNSVACKKAIAQAAKAFLIEAAGELTSQVKRNTRVDTGQTKGSWRYEIKENEALVGSPLENTIWEEFGTGQYALKGNGRKTPWKYKDAKGNWHTTTGKKPSRALFNAFTKLKPKIQKMAEEKFKGIK